MTEPTCAVWYWSHFILYVELCDTEEQAARFAHDLADEGSPCGIQYDDGSYVDRHDWAAFEEESERRWREAEQWVKEQQNRPRPATRELKAPFDTDRTATVTGACPPWLGRHE